MDNLLLPTLVEKFITFFKSQGRSPFTIIAYKKDLEQFIGHLSTQEIDDIRRVKKEDIESFIKKMLSQNYTKKSVSRKLNSVRTFFRFLKSEGIISQNPSLEVSHPKYTQTPPRIFNKLEYRALRDVSKNNPRTYALLEILLQTGIKISELSGLCLSDIKKDTLYIRGSNHTKGREIPLNGVAKKAINQYLKVRNKTDDNHIFITRTGKPLIVRNIRQIIGRCFDEVEIKNATVNDIRNTFIAYQLKNGASIEYIARLVGHKRLSSTERYLSFIEQKKKKKEKLEQL